VNQSIIQVDAFTDKPFSGNPAAVCIMPEARGDDWMQNVAREMNLSETAFLVKVEDGYNLRWFTPAIEVDLCGHATLASAHVLYELREAAVLDKIHFHTRSGLLIASMNGDWIELDFPAKPGEKAECPDVLLEALGFSADKVQILKNRMDYMIVVDSEEIVRSIKPDFNLLASIEMRGVMVTAKSDSQEYDFVSRFFAPLAGVNEDPVTGSAHCCLAPYWCEKLGKDKLTGYQASARGGMVGVRINGDRVVISGQAVTVFRGELVF
jgi:PhzF family phenazine biosynthesis protein